MVRNHHLTAEDVEILSELGISGLLRRGRISPLQNAMINILHASERNDNNLDSGGGAVQIIRWWVAIGALDATTGDINTQFPTGDPRNRVNRMMEAGRAVVTGDGEDNLNLVTSRWEELTRLERAIASSVPQYAIGNRQPPAIDFFALRQFFATGGLVPNPTQIAIIQSIYTSSATGPALQRIHHVAGVSI